MSNKQIRPKPNKETKRRSNSPELEMNASKSKGGCMFSRLKSKMANKRSEDSDSSDDLESVNRPSSKDRRKSKNRDKTASVLNNNSHGDVKCVPPQEVKADTSKSLANCELVSKVGEMDLEEGVEVTEAGANLSVSPCNQSGAEESHNSTPIVQSIPPSTSSTSSVNIAHQQQPLTRPVQRPAQPVQNASSQVNIRTPPLQQEGNAPQSHTTQNIYARYDSLTENGTFSHRTVHTQIDYMHCLVPDQWGILNAPFYWGQIDRFQADALLAGQPEGSFILRDSSQEEFVFSVSFRRYGRTLHARIEQWNHNFTFDAHDPGVYSSKTICNLLKRYRDPNFCMFFEPMLTVPLLKRNPQSLQELCRARVCTNMKYDDISKLKLPIALRQYLRVYHYKQRLRVRRMEVDGWPAEDNQPGVITNTCLSSVMVPVVPRLSLNNSES